LEIKEEEETQLLKMKSSLRQMMKVLFPWSGIDQESLKEIVKRQKWNVEARLSSTRASSVFFEEFAKPSEQPSKRQASPKACITGLTTNGSIERMPSSAPRVPRVSPPLRLPRL
jgi:hypothetical protein